MVICLQTPTVFSLGKELFLSAMQCTRG